MGTKVKRTRRSLRTTRRDWKSLFIEALQKTPNVTKACEIAKVSRGHAYTTRGVDDEFRRRWDEADEAAIDKIEQAGIDMATSMRPESAGLIKFFLQTRRPDRYPNVSKLELGGVGGGPVPIATTAMTEQEAADLYLAKLKRR